MYTQNINKPYHINYIPESHNFVDRNTHTLNHSHTHVFDATGNKIGLALYESPFPQEAMNNKAFMQSLQKAWIGKNIDTVMILHGSPENFARQGYHYETLIFEPNAGQYGAWSTMCGNGACAVAALVKESYPSLKEVTLKTPGGILSIKTWGELFQVDMGYLYTDAATLSRYLNSHIIRTDTHHYTETAVPVSIQKVLNLVGLDIPTWSIGLTSSQTEKSQIDGEPHVVIELPAADFTIEQMRHLCVTIGQLITNNFELFPLGMNVNFFTRQGDRLLLTTHERNLGTNPDTATTLSCGTGATVVGGLLLAKTNCTSVEVQSQGGTLTISQANGRLCLAGCAVRIDG